MRIGDANENLSAMQAIAMSQQATAHNIANINTDEFHAQEVMLETGPDGEGVVVSEIRESSAEGPLIQQEIIVETPEGGTEQVSGVVEGSNTDIVRETVNMIQNEIAFEANVEAAQTQTELIGQFIDEMV